jgi:hypothetical protein
MRIVLLVGAVSLAAACGRTDRPGLTADSAAAAKAAPADVALKLPPGFTATVCAEGIGSTRHIAAALNNNIYVNTWRSPYDTTAAHRRAGSWSDSGTPMATARRI